MISEGYITNGATVYISSRDAKACEQAVGELNALGKGKAHAIPADFYKEEEIKRLAEELGKRESSTFVGVSAVLVLPIIITRMSFAELHVLVNNSGSNWGAPYDEYPSSAWTRVLTLNLHRVFDLTKSLTPLLEKGASEGDPSRIINIGSVDGLRVPVLETFAYSASKAGLHHLSRVLASHLGKRNITFAKTPVPPPHYMTWLMSSSNVTRSNTLACGPFRSKMMAATLRDMEEVIKSGIPLNRIGTPEDVAGACLFLSSRAGSYVTGATIAVDGGSVVGSKL